MCGLCGIVHRDPARRVVPAELLAMRDTMEARGPDDAGHHLGPGVGLGSRRLAILDRSERGHMPMQTADGRYHIVYNGEVYNSPELRRDLEARGATLRSHTDTEVVLHLFVRDGPAMLGRLNGMFAIAIWDAAERALFVARDRLGVKPLYYVHDRDGTLRFASEAKALFATGLTPTFDVATWEELLCFRYVAGERTPYEGVRRLLPGHYLVWRDGHLTTRRWWNLAERAAERRAHPPADARGWFRETFDDAVRLRRLSDVPLGVLLSGGLDSSSVAAALAEQAGAGVESFTVRFDEPGYDESALSRQVVERWGLTRHELSVERGDLLSRLLQASWLNDEPLAHGNELHLWAISEYAKPRVTVLLSGEGADETLGGYVRYRPLQHHGLVALARVALRPVASRLGSHRRLQKLGRTLAALGTMDELVLYNAADVLPVDLHELGVPALAGLDFREHVLEEARACHPGEPVRQAMYADQHTFLCSLLDRNDRMTMGASIECRVPFLDYRLVEGLAALPTRTLFSAWHGKPLLRESVGDRLPPAVLRGRKWGFGVPWAHYLREVPDLRAVVATLPDAAPIADLPIDRDAVRRFVSEFLAGDHRRDAVVRQLVLLTLWYQSCVAAPRERKRVSA